MKVIIMVSTKKKEKIRINGYFGSENGISRNSESVLRIF